MAEGEGSGTVTPGEEEEESGISMVEVLEEEQEREMDAAAVLGASDDTSCTYDQVGYRAEGKLFSLFLFASGVRVRGCHMGVE